MTDGTPDVYRKLQIKPPARVLLLDAPDGFAARLGAVPEGVDLVVADAAAGPNGPAAGFDAVLCPVRTAAEIADRAPAALAAARPGGLVWFAYPKRGKGTETDINRDSGWAPVVAAGWNGVRQVAIDDAWSALRFRPELDIRRKPDSIFATRAG